MKRSGGGRWKLTHGRIRSLLDEHSKITIKIDRDSLKTYDEFCETEKDEEAVMDYLERHDRLSWRLHGAGRKSGYRDPPARLVLSRMTSSRMSFSES